MAQCGALRPSSSTGQHPLLLHAGTAAFLLLIVFTTGMAPAEESWSTIQSPRAGKAPKPHIGSAMAVLATLEQAQVLPPDNTPAANQVIKSVIQFQSAFAKSDDRFVQDFAARALAKTQGDRAAAVLAQVRSTGWNAALLEALAEADAQAPAEEVQRLATGFSRFNLSTNDFHHFMQLVREAQSSLEKQGLSFQQVFASHRQTMPGANSQP
jgi:hypothetical protein